MQDKHSTVQCPSCGRTVPAGDKCPHCGARLPVKLGSMTDDQIKRIRRPITILCWVVIAGILIYRFFLR